MVSEEWVLTPEQRVAAVRWEVHCHGLLAKDREAIEEAEQQNQ